MTTPKITTAREALEAAARVAEPMCGGVHCFHNACRERRIIQDTIRDLDCLDDSRDSPLPVSSSPDPLLLAVAEAAEEYRANPTTHSFLVLDAALARLKEVQRVE